MQSSFPVPDYFITKFFFFTFFSNSKFLENLNFIFLLSSWLGGISLNSVERKVLAPYMWEIFFQVHTHMWGKTCALKFYFSTSLSVNLWILWMRFATLQATQTWRGGALFSVSKNYLSFGEYYWMWWWSVFLHAESVSQCFNKEFLYPKSRRRLGNHLIGKIVCNIDVDYPWDRIQMNFVRSPLWVSVNPVKSCMPLCTVILSTNGRNKLMLWHQNGGGERNGNRRRCERWAKIPVKTFPIKKRTNTELFIDGK